MVDLPYLDYHDFLFQSRRSSSSLLLVWRSLDYAYRHCRHQSQRSLARSVLLADGPFNRGSVENEHYQEKHPNGFRRIHDSEQGQGGDEGIQGK